jgi:hypothetical protein
MFADEASRLDEPAVLLRRATVIGDEKIQVRPLVMDTISAASL